MSAPETQPHGERDETARDASPYFWAKTTKDDQPGISVRDHCVNVGCVAKALISALPQPLRDLLPPGAVTLAALHDIGKISPGFQQKCDQWCRDTNHSRRNYEGNHAFLSLRFIQQISGQDGWEHWAQAVGMHHGDFPKGRWINEGSVLWPTARDALLRELSSPDFFGPLPDRPPKSEAEKWLVAGLTAFADWIGSDLSFFHANKEPQRQLEGQRTVAKHAVHKLAIAAAEQIRPGLEFRGIWGVEARPFQSVVMETIQEPGVYVIEAPMGAGKTEAALTAAYSLMARKLANGLYFALPTQTTSNRIHERVARFLRKVSTAEPDTYLIHGASWLKRGEMPDWRNESADPSEKELALRRRWFASARKALVAPFGVGTVDQALLGTIAVYFFFVRLFALAGKVVILDEVHSYDAYTGGLLQVLVQRLRDLGSTVIILSATLTKNHRSALLPLPVPAEDRRKDEAWLTGLTAKGDPIVKSAPPGVSAKEVELRCGNPPVEQVAKECLGRAGAGQCVLWICNTVDAAIQARRQVVCQRQGLLKDGAPGVGLLHSRFPYFRREQLEGKWLRRLGRANKWRPKGCVLVSTQIVEQSVDIDADWLVTELAPTDMLFQRFGRLWRHFRWPLRRGGLRSCSAFILTPDLTNTGDAAAVGKAFGPNGRVYDPFVLARSWRLWHALPSVRVPDDIRDMLEATYAPFGEGDPPEWRELAERYGRKIEFMARLAVNNANVEAHILDDDEEAETPLGKMRGTRLQKLAITEVLLVRRIVSRTPLRFVLLDGTAVELYQQHYHIDRKAAFHAAQAVHRNVVKVPSWWLEALAEPKMPALSEHFFGRWHVAEVSDTDGQLKFAENDPDEQKLRLLYNRDEGVKLDRAPPKKREYLDDDRFQFDD